MGMRAELAQFGMTPSRFVSEVQEFRAYVANPAFTPEDKKRAYGLIVTHATMVNPADAGYEAAGVALKEAACTWLDSQFH